MTSIKDRAIEDEIIENRNPFRQVYTEVDKTVNPALPLSAIKIIKALDLYLMPELDYARVMFIMSFMLRGMSFIDMAYLRKSDRVAISPTADARPASSLSSNGRKKCR